MTVLTSQIVDEAIAFALNPDKPLPEKVLALQGYSSPMVRHLLNKLCSNDRIGYLEVGVWKGSTHIAALYGNDLEKSVAIDNFSETWGFSDEGVAGYLPDTALSRRAAERDFRRNCKRLLGRVPWLLTKDFLDAAEVLPLNTFNVYLYDGDHANLSQEQALTEMIDALTDTFVFIVDDWAFEGVRAGTFEGIEECGLQTLATWELEADYVGDVEKWWNGLGIFLLTKEN